MARLSVGDRIAHYEIRAWLGAGGMGEVYLAEDQTLHRPVALKVLASTMRECGDLLPFLAEARAASAMNHPNVAHIYEIRDTGSIVCLVMEYVEGETLERRIAAGPLSEEITLDLALQIADALVEAHAKGIVHRDLKPGNIVINGRGQVKILDFGIARRISGDAASQESDQDPGTMLGTLPYMSPEQTRGTAVDHRSDLWAFGVIVYEMLTGRHPFEGGSGLEVLRNISEQALPPLPPKVADGWRRILERCLEKERELRFETPAALLAAMRALRRGQPDTPMRHRSGLLVIGALSVIVLAASFQIARWRSPREGAPPQTPMKLVKITSAPGLEDEPALSPDGTFLAYTADARGNLDIFVRPVAGGEAIRITDSDADDAQPAWSPDRRQIAFVSARDTGGRLSIVLGQALGNFISAQGGDLFIMPAQGGEARKLIANAYYPAWSPDGRWIAFQSSRGGRWDLWKIAVPGGELVQLTSDPQFDYQPSWSPDGREIVYCSGMPEPYRIRMIPASGGAPQTISDGKDAVLLRPLITRDGRSIVFSSNRGGSLNLWRLPLDEAYGAAGPPERLTLGEGDDVSPALAAGSDRVAYATVRQTPDLWSLDVQSGDAEQVTFDTGREEYPHHSRDGVLVFSSDRGGRDALWLRSPEGALTELVVKPGAGQPRWSPDGSRIAYRYPDPDGKSRLVVQRPGSAELQTIARNAEAPAWSPDGRWLAFTSWDRQTPSQIFVAPVDGSSEPRKVTSLGMTTSYPTWSPDGKSLALQMTREDGTRHVWVVDLVSGEARQLTRGASEDSHPQWSPVDADSILFVRNHENLMEASVSTGEVRALTRYAEPNLVLDYPGWSADGKRVDFSIARKRGDLYLLEHQPVTGSEKRPADANQRESARP